MRTTTLPFGLLLAAVLAYSHQEPMTHAAEAPDAGVAASFPQAPKPSAPAAIASAEGSRDRIRVDVTELKRTTGGTLSLKFTIVNDSSGPLQVSDVGVGSGALIGGADYKIDGVHLIDLVGKKKYFVAKDTAGSCVCSQFGAIPPGNRANHWARFSAPPENVERLTVVIPSFAPMDDVPVSR